MRDEDLENAKDEFLLHIQDRIVKCAKITFDEIGWKEEPKWIYLKVGYSKMQYDMFLDYLDQDYDSGFGIQELHGLIWYEDGTWSERREYDGCEGWTYKQTPEIDSQLKP